MLIQPNSEKLGDKLLSPQEALKASFEDTERSVSRYRLDDHDELKNIEKKMGKPMQHNELIRRVIRLNAGIWAEDSNNDKSAVGFYRVGPDGSKEYLVA